MICSKPYYWFKNIETFHTNIRFPKCFSLKRNRNKENKYYLSIALMSYHFAVD